MSTAAILFRDPLLTLYGVENVADHLAALIYDTAIIRIFRKWPAFFIYAIMNACSGAIRGLGKSSLSAIIAFFTTCVFRIGWIFTVFKDFENLESIFISYPISWLLAVIVFVVLFFVLISKEIRKTEA